MEDVSDVLIHRSKKFIQTLSVKNSGNKKLAVVVRVISSVSQRRAYSCVINQPLMFVHSSCLQMCN